MTLRTIRIAAALAGCILLWTGCIRTGALDPAITPDPVSPGSGPAAEAPINFTASPLLRDDATKSGEIKTDFENTDCFYAYGTKTIGGVPSVVFNGDAVTYDGSAWDYSPHRFWDSNASVYDFLAVTGPSSTSGIRLDGTNPLAIDVDYNALVAQYDLMAASHRRSSGNTSVVNLTFHHVLSAVDVTIYNDSPALDITLLSYGFRHIYTFGRLEAEAVGGDSPSISWDPQSDATNTVLGSNPEPDASLPHVSEGSSSFYPATTVTDLMVPQSLEVHGTAVPSLVLEYQYMDGTETVTVSNTITLSEIKMFGTDNFITEWSPGTRYHYELHLRMGGGIRIHVTTTEWDVIHAETPGLTI